MSRRNRRSTQELLLDHHPDWSVSLELNRPGLGKITVGTELRIHGQVGQVFRFMRHVSSPRGEWVDVYGGSRDPNGIRSVRSFPPERIAQTYRKAQLRSK